MSKREQDVETIKPKDIATSLSGWMHFKIRFAKKERDTMSVTHVTA